MKIRSGCEGGGKGAIMQMDKSATVSMHNDQTLFEPVKCYDIADRRAVVSENADVCYTLTEKMGKGGNNVPVVLESDARDNCLTPWDVQSRRIYGKDGTWPSLYAGEGGGHGYVAIEESDVIPIADKATRYKGGGDTRNEDGAGNGLGVGEAGSPAYTLTAGDRHCVAYSLQGNMIGRADKNGPQGSGVNENVSFTLNATDRHAVAYSFDKAAYNQGEHSSYGIGLLEETAHTLTAGWQPPAVAYGIQQNADGELRSSGTSATLSTNGNASGRNSPLVMQAKAIAYDCRNHAVNEELSGTLQAKENGGQSLNYINPVAVPETAGTLAAKMAKGTGGPAGDECQNLVAELPEYKIRRLIPLECGRLQGFPDGWTEGLALPDPDEETVDRWEVIFEEHRRLTGQPENRRRRSQIVKWLKNPYSDTALYRMWGNGIALPCAAFVMKGIVQELIGGEI
ncbi:MAG: hypothetical protein Q4C66_13480 [Lachnospiraceae bacterium]|nr:hypothetical protein [Lachnospiraceae bacterium]